MSTPLPAIELQRTNPDAFRAEYAILKEGAKIGTVAQKYRPKNAGGSAWCATIDEAAIPNRVASRSVGVTVYSSTTAKLREIIQHVITPGSVAPHHWR